MDRQAFGCIAAGVERTLVMAGVRRSPVHSQLMIGTGG
jgi:hypothetical protein